MIKSRKIFCRYKKKRNKEDICTEFEKLKKVIAEVLNVDEAEITMDTTFEDDLGADSLDIVQIIMGMEEELDIEIDSEAAADIVTVGDAVEAIKMVKKNKNDKKPL